MTEYGHKLFKEFKPPAWACRGSALQPASPGLQGQSWLPGHQLQITPQFRCGQRHRLTHRPLQHPGTVWRTILGPSLRENIHSGRSSCWWCWWTDWMEHGVFFNWRPGACHLSTSRMWCPKRRKQAQTWQACWCCAGEGCAVILSCCSTKTESRVLWGLTHSVVCQSHFYAAPWAGCACDHTYGSWAEKCPDMRLVVMQWYKKWLCSQGHWKWKTHYRTSCYMPSLQLLWWIRQACSQHVRGYQGNWGLD